nr:MAG TPA: hypothetical protein [Caudoviricetes sp.]DAH32263.1 MAG TPA: hypothetical protein [Caudoviricetes sp.]
MNCKIRYRSLGVVFGARVASEKIFMGWRYKLF